MSLRPCTRFLRDYVALPSVNPMGRDDVPPEIAGERRYAEHVRAQLARLGLDAVLVGADDRPSVVAEATAPGASDTVLIASHLDTVPVDTMEIDPFDPVIEGDRLYGRGSCDTKGGMAACLDALERVLERGRLRRNIVIVGEADEELGSRGVHDVLDHLGARRPDWVLATEPTDLRLVTHHKGIAIARLAASGRACHSSDPDAGSNAIVALSRAVLALHGLGERLAERTDPVLGRATLSVGRVGGGQAPNIVPDHAWLVCDRRLVPGEDEASVRADLEGALAGDGVTDVAVETCRVEKPPLATERSHPVVERCLRLLAAESLPGEPTAVAFGTDAGLFDAVGVPAVVFGPGSIAQAHTAREHVPIRELESAADWFARLFESAD